MFATIVAEHWKNKGL